MTSHRFQSFFRMGCRQSAEDRPVLLGLRVLVYDKHRDGHIEDMSDMNDHTVEEVCEKLAKQTNICPAFIHCFGLQVVGNKDVESYWLAPGDIVKTDFNDKNIHFRMRFVPPEEKLKDLLRADESCTKYLFYQVKYDFVHGRLSSVTNKAKEQEVKGLIVILIFIMIRIETVEVGIEFDNVRYFLQTYRMKQFKPPLLTQKIFADKKIMNGSIIDHVEKYLQSYPRERPEGHYTHFMKSLIGVMVKEEVYHKETYSAWKLTFCDIGKDSDADLEQNQQPSIDADLEQNQQPSIENKVGQTVEVLMCGRESKLRISPADGVSTYSIYV